MVKQYPHYLFAVGSGSESTQDENGDWSESEPSNELIGMCREETDGRGSKIQVADGTFHQFTSLIQLPKGVDVIAVGTTVIISNDADGSDVRITGEVLKFDVGQMHSRLWV